MRMIQRQSNKIRWLIIDPHIALQQAMHSASTRFNGITLFTCTVLGVLCALNWAQGYLLFNPKTQAQFQITSVTNFINTSRWDQASFKYSLEADLSSLYTWNLKQLFVYIECEWVDPKTNITSSSIVTDWILQLPEDKANLQKNWTISVQNQRLDYLLRDVYHSLRANSLKFSLKAEYMPIVGFFFKTQLSELTYQMPEKYTNQAVK